MFQTSSGYIRTFDDKGECFVKHRAACNNSGDIRLEKMKIYPELRLLAKDVTYGKQNIWYGDTYRNIIDVKNRMSHILDIDSNSVMCWSADSHPLKYEDEWLSIGEGVDISTPGKILLPEGVTTYQTNKLDHCFPSYDMTSVQVGIESTEDLLQMSYTQSVGFLTAFFSQWSYGFPFDSYVIIDTKMKKFNIPMFKYLNIVDKDYGLHLYAHYFKRVSEMVDLLCENCERWNRKLRIYVFTSAYSTVIKIKDLDGQGLRLDFNLNASDHWPSIITNTEADGNQYCLSEESWIVLKDDKLGDVSDKMTSNYYSLGLPPF